MKFASIKDLVQAMIVSLVAIGAVAILCGMALAKGIDGAVAMTSFAVIGGVAGAYLGKRLDFSKLLNRGNKK